MCLAVKQGLILQMLKMLVWNNDYVGVRLDKFYKDSILDELLLQSSWIQSEKCINKCKLKLFQ
jgi:hypothetical protein